MVAAGLRTERAADKLLRVNRARAVRSRESVDPIRFSRWACRACVGADAVLLVLLLAGTLGWGVSASVVAVVLLAVLVGATVVFVRLSPIAKLAFPPSSSARAGHAEATAGEGWSSWSIPRRAEMVERARAVRALTATLERGGPIAPSERPAAGVHAYRQVAAYTQGTTTSSLLVAVAVPQLLGRHSLGWPWFGAALLVGVAVLLVFNVRRAGRWQRIAEDHELVERRGSR